MKKTKWIMPLLALGIVLASCTGKDGDPGPQGDPGAAGATGATGATGAAGEGFQKIGYFQGTVAGKRTDGTAFSEAFKFEYGPTTQGFDDVNGVKTLDVYRYNKGDYSTSEVEISNLELSGNNLVVNPNSTTVFFEFSKELNTTDLFYLNARPYFKDRASYVLEISDTQNATYHFQISSDGTIDYDNSSYSDANNQYVDAYSFYYNNNSFYYRKDNGALGAIYDYSTGKYVYSGTLFDTYNKLTFKNDAAKGKLTFFDKATNTSLGVVIPAIPADAFTITNYSQDATTGIISFDYSIKISKDRPRTGYNIGLNTTGNDLTITGSFNSGGKVYKNIVSRTSSGG